MKSRSARAALLVIVSITLTMGMLDGAFRLNRKFGWVRPLSVQDDSRAPPMTPRLAALVERVRAALAVPGGRIPARVEVSSSWDDPPDRQHMENQFLPFPKGSGIVRRNRVTLRSTKSRRELYTATYSMNARRHRVVSDPHPVKGRNKSLVFFGCSFTFGEGVNDSETLPAQVEALLPGYHAYDFGEMGSSAADAHLELTEATDSLDVTEPDGLAVFTFIDDHLIRLEGTLQKLARGPQAIDRPVYRLRDGRPVHLGTFIGAEPVRTRLLNFLGHSALLSFFNVDFPRPGPRTEALASKLLGEIQELARSKLHTRKLFVLIYPGERRYAADLVSLLEREGVETLDYSAVELSEILEGRQYIPGGVQHPSPEAYRFVARLLTEDLRDRGAL